MAVTTAFSSPSILFDPLAYLDVSVRLPTFDASLDQQRPGFETGPRRALWQGRSAPIVGICPDGARFFLRGLPAVPYRADGLSDRGASAGALPQRYRCLGRPPERDLLPQRARVICELECRPLRVSWRSRPRRNARSAELTTIRSVMVSAIIGSRLRRRRRLNRVERPAREARDRCRGRI